MVWMVRISRSENPFAAPTLTMPIVSPYATMGMHRKIMRPLTATRMPPSTRNQLMMRRLKGRHPRVGTAGWEGMG
jgi:hypothetical protein